MRMAHICFQLISSDDTLRRHILFNLQYIVCKMRDLEERKYYTSPFMNGKPDIS